MTAELPVFLDTNILTYAYDVSEGERHARAHQILKECFEGKRVIAISNQVLAEFGRIVLFKIEHPLTLEKVQEIVDSIMCLSSFIKINYSCSTYAASIHSFEQRSKYWDALIVQTMKENGIKKIYTENTKDFEAAEGIQAINPFK
mgnify:CR=1 FL=1